MKTCSFLVPVIATVHAVSTIPAIVISDDGWQPIPNNSNIQRLGQCAVHEENKFESGILRFIHVVSARIREEMTYELIINVFVNEVTQCFKAVVFSFDQDKPEHCGLVSFDLC
jgi:hypothetical protein